MSVTRIVIEIEDDASPEQVKRMLRDANRRQSEEALDHWIDLETPFMCLHVTRIVGELAEEAHDGYKPDGTYGHVHQEVIRPL